MAQTGRADLLLALHLGAAATADATHDAFDDDIALTLDHDDTHRWGYRREPKAEPPPEPLTLTLPTLQAPPPAAEPGTAAPSDDPLRMPLQMPLAWALRDQTVRDLPQEVQSLPALTADDLRALTPDPLPYRDLVPWARALPGLRRQTDRQVAGGIDWRPLTESLARRELPRRLPRRTWARWPQRLILVLDFSPRLDPYRWDFHRLAERIAAQVPAASLSVRLLRHGPAGPWQPWPHPHRPPPPQELHEWEARLAPGTVLLFASDLGLFDTQPARHRAWLAWADALRAQGCRLVALAPVGAGQPTAEAVQRFELMRWSPDSRWHRERRAPAASAAEPFDPLAGAQAEPPADGDALSALVALAATAIRIDPPLLRAWRSLIGNDAGLEGRLWNHPHLELRTVTCSTRSEHLDADLARHAALPVALRQAARVVQHAQHAHLRRSLGQAEALRWDATAGPATGRALSAGADTPLGFVKRLLHSLSDPAAPPEPALRRSLLGAAELMQSAASERVRAQDPALFAELDAAVARWRSGQSGSVVPGTAAVTSMRMWQLVQRGPALVMAPFGASGPSQRLGEPVEVPVSAQGVWLQMPGSNRRLPLGDDGVELALLGLSPDRLSVSLDQYTWVLKQVVRPDWAMSFRQEQGRTFGVVKAPGLRADGWAEQAFFEPVWGNQRTSTPDGRALVGLDSYGAYANVVLRPPTTGVSRVVDDLQLLLRWIPPGRFLMGSPDGVGDRDEHPQHPVRISQGFWLAEGPCTQQLWQAVMGNNPSGFKDEPDAPQRPVENVSFDDVQPFLERLRAWLPPGCEPALPTEAEWEYAARAGKSAEYPWGDEPDDARANWGGQHDGTTPVGRFPANPWGLFDMQGNVWEWCADVKRTYTAEPQRDPYGDLFGPPRRALRGGSWEYHRAYARSASRGDWHPSGRDRDVSFRLALRPSSPGAGGPVSEPAEPVQRVSRPGGPPAGAGRPGDDAGWFQRTLAGVRNALTPGRSANPAGKPTSAPPGKKRR